MVVEESSSMEPLMKLLESINGRLSVIENKVGISVGNGSSSTSSGSAPATGTSSNGESPAVKAYKEHVTTFVVPLVQTCTSLSNMDNNEPKMKDIALCIQNAWDGIGHVIQLASMCRKPIGGTQKIQEALMPYLKQTQDAISSCRKIRLKREYDNHQKALMEFFSSASWVLMFPPPTSPSNHIKETLGAMEFYSNKIRKECKGIQGKELHIQFCDQTKAIILDLSNYTKEYHGLGLSFNPNGCTTLEAGAKLLLETSSTVTKKDDSVETTSETKSSSNNKAESGSGGGGGGIKALMSELANKSTKDGSSAATGLKKVTKEQQTWRKEYNSDAAAAGEMKQAPAGKKAASAVVVLPKSSTTKPPVYEFDDVGQKWKIEYQTKETNSHLKVKVSGRNEQVYIYKCTNITVEISGKLKAIVVDNSTKVNVVFDTVISGFEIVNSKNIQIQTLGICPTISIDKTDGCMIYLSNESKHITNFMTSKSSEMNVSFPDDNNELQETPIPEQFQHKLVNGSMTSTVSDLYH